ncbi:phosphotransferase [Virgibacillus sp. MSP4-1]|uniref:aminoglycoside phosphotransferase family protein n=1 Tax=Virgibacillus sp. MSP4-1 TaxID=2700081 RepID=UPI0003AA618B|nr:aminoglycoside phosphotransferase family protein [Virgibacillus sp. MSP4-1]QHS24206.1 phosphotransferase [Virgibacillus sp. MSP4-1]
MKMGRKIGEGANAEVFEWENNNKVIKLAKPNIDKSDLEREFRNNLIMWNLSLPVPKPFEIAEFNQRPGIVYERVYGKTLRERFFENLISNTNNHTKLDWKDVRLTARLLGKIHSLSHNELPNDQRDLLKKQILSVNKLHEEEKKSVINKLDCLPVKDKVCHGDANPNNIIISNGEALLIDWMNAATGNPEADLAEFIIMIRYAILPPETPQNAVRIFDNNREKIIKAFMDEYTLSTGTTYEEVHPWVIPILARKLSSDGIIEEEKELLLNEIKRRLEK